MTVDPFEVAVAEVLRHEGGYVDDPADPGGETNFGISKRAYPHVDIKGLTQDQAVEIYRRDYWQATGCDQLPPAIAIAVFDAAVNMGKRPAVQLLQEVLGVATDGILGPVTAHAATVKDHRELLVDYLARRAVYYAGLKTFSRFALGWMRRLLSVHQRCLLRGAGEGA